MRETFLDVGTEPASFGADARAPAAAPAPVALDLSGCALSSVARIPRTDSSPPRCRKGRRGASVHRLQVGVECLFVQSVAWASYLVRPWIAVACFKSPEDKSALHARCSVRKYFIHS